MGANYNNYSLYLKFIEKYQPSGFADINRNDQFIKEMELMTQTNNQFYFIADLIMMKIIFCSERSKQMIGIDPEVLSPYHMNQATPNDELHRLGLAIANRMKVATDYEMEKKGSSLLSTNIKLNNPEGFYSNVLYQCYTYYSPTPNNTVYQLQIHTNIDWFGKLKSNSHYYCGNDMSKFRFPDEELLDIGSLFSDREFEILGLLGNGYSSGQIADKLFISTHTVNTHRRNILQKSGHDRIQELIAELRENGML